MTNATKANLIGILNAGLALAVGFHAPLSDAQIGLVGGFANAVLVLYVALTYRNSPKRVPGS